MMPPLKHPLVPMLSRSLQIIEELWEANRRCDILGQAALFREAAELKREANRIGVPLSLKPPAQREVDHE
jgi:hypothetical protein